MQQKKHKFIKISLIIWDKVIMTNRQFFEPLDISFKDIMSEQNPHAKMVPFGGNIIILGCDLRPILHVIGNGTKSQIISVAIIKSFLWNYVQIIKLTENMRLKSKTNNTIEYQELQDFSK